MNSLLLKNRTMWLSCYAKELHSISSFLFFCVEVGRTYKMGIKNPVFVACKYGIALLNYRLLASLHFYIYYYTISGLYFNVFFIFFHFVILAGVFELANCHDYCNTVNV